jgi:hypothetical protein
MIKSLSNSSEFLFYNFIISKPLNRDISPMTVGLGAGTNFRKKVNNIALKVFAFTIDFFTSIPMTFLALINNATILNIRKFFVQKANQRIRTDYPLWKTSIKIALITTAIVGCGWIVRKYGPSIFDRVKKFFPEKISNINHPDNKNTDNEYKVVSFSKKVISLIGTGYAYVAPKAYSLLTIAANKALAKITELFTFFWSLIPPKKSSNENPNAKGGTPPTPTNPTTPENKSKPPEKVETGGAP